MTKTTKLKLTDMEISEALGIVRASGRLGPETTISLIDDVKALRVLVTKFSKEINSEDDIKTVAKLQYFQTVNLSAINLRMAALEERVIKLEGECNGKGEINERTT